MASSDADVVQRVQRAVADALARLGLTDSTGEVVAAVSGGADSLCLLDALVATLPQARRRLFVVHVDHRIRPTSRQDALHVAAIGAGYGLRCAVCIVDVPALAASEGRGIEEAARFGRYRALRDVPGARGGRVVATGHTSDDSVETVLLNLLRGSGRRGLGGISEDERLDSRALGESNVRVRKRLLRVVRPLVEVSRAETVAYCQARGLDWRVDETNADPRFTRNRVRAHLLPVLRTYNSAVDRSLLRMAQLLRDEDDWVDAVARRRKRRITPGRGGGSALTLSGWQRQPLPIRRRIVRHIASSLGYDEIGFEAVERALAVGSDDGPRRAELGGGMTVERQADTLFFNRTQRQSDD